MSNQDKVFIESINNNNIKKVKELLAINFDLLYTRDNYALRWASYYNYTELTLFLIQQNKNIDFYLQKLVLFNSARNNNFEIFKSIYDPNIFDLYTIEYNHTNILLTLIDNNKKNTDIEFVDFILNSIKEKIDKFYIRDILDISFEFADIDIIEVFIKNDLIHLFDINKPLEDFFDNKIIYRQPELAVKFIQMLEKYFDLYKSEYKFYIFLISAIENYLKDCYLYIIKNYDLNKIPKNFLSHVINGILRTDDVLTLKLFNDQNFIEDYDFTNKIAVNLIFEGQYEGLFYIIENFDLSEELKQSILKNSLQYRTEDLFSILLSIINTDLSFDNCFLVREIIKRWKNDSKDYHILNVLLNDKNISSYINNSWIEKNISEDKIDFIKIENNSKRF